VQYGGTTLIDLILLCQCLCNASSKQEK